jgi:hypothetical protein
MYTFSLYRSALYETDGQSRTIRVFPFWCLTLIRFGYLNTADRIVLMIQNVAAKTNNHRYDQLHRDTFLVLPH